MSGGDDWDGRLGYGNPPPWGRFKKGRSGNPKGRPKKERGVNPLPLTADASDAILKKQMEREYRVTENGETSSLQGIEIIRRAQFQSAAKGSPHAQRQLIQDFRELELRQAAELQRIAKEKEEEFELDRQWHDIKRKAWKAADATGCEPENPWPHPDDFVFDEVNRTCRIRGPINQADVPLFEYCRLERDIAFARATYDRFFRKRPTPGAFSIWDPVWIFYNARLPKRWQTVDLATDESAIAERYTSKKLERAIEADAQRAAVLRSLLKFAPHDKEVEKMANAVMKPLLQQFGYRSIAHLEASLGQGLSCCSLLSSLI